VDIDVERRKKTVKLLVRVSPALLCERDYVNQFSVSERRYDATPDGLLRAIVESKEIFAQLRRGYCETCLALQPPKKKLKIKGLPACALCVLTGAMNDGATK
jgi:hypothetical protein